MTFFAVIVLYNTFVQDSLTIRNLSKIIGHDIRIIIVDNSTREMGNKIETLKCGWSYISMAGNAGLSRAYNAVLNYLKNEIGIIIWFDDDTDVTQEYFDKLEEAVTHGYDYDIFVPIIQGQDGKFWSPNEARFFKNKQMKNRNQVVSNKRINAINSCTAVRCSVYDDYRYDERLFLDQVDHNFFADQRKLKRKVYIIDTVIQHNFSIKSKMTSIDNVKNRYKIMIPDFLTYCEKSKAKYLLGLIKVAGWGIREGIKYKSINFFFWCILEAMNWKKRRNDISG